MNPAAWLRNLPLRVQYMLLFCCLAVAPTAISIFTLTALSTRRTEAVLRDKSLQYARQLQNQLRTVVEFDDQLTAREQFAALGTDPNVDGLGVYDGRGFVIAGWGIRPRELPSMDAPLQSGAGHVIAIAPIRSREGTAGRLFVSLTTNELERQERRAIQGATLLGTAIVLCALLLAVAASRRFSHRLVVIADAAKRMAAGQLIEAIDDRAKDEIGALARTFNMMVVDLDRLSQERERMAHTERERLEGLVAERTRDLAQDQEMFRLMAESTHAIPFTLDATQGVFSYIGMQACAEWGISELRWRQPGALDAAFRRPAHDDLHSRIDACAEGHFEFESPIIRADGSVRAYRWTGTCARTESTNVMRGLMQDITELRQLEHELFAAQKLESVGRLAAGVAHEINTPVQFVSDNVQFVRTATKDFESVCLAYRQLQVAVQLSGDVAAAARTAEGAEAAADLDFILENVPLALGSAMDGLERIATIVRSIKNFAHPDQGQRALADLNQAIQSTVVMAHNEYKYVADLVTDYRDLPPISCYIGEINQVVLNLLINAAHAIGDVVGDGNAKGRITVRTRLDGGEVEISISDTGTGIPESAREKIFEPFFTTKAVGRGTGQGLAIARSVVVNKHGGTLRFETESGRGTTFFIRLPVDGSADDVKKFAA